MTVDSVPWFVGGGAQHSPEVARLLAYAATSGAEGIVEPADLKVIPLDVPGGAVRVSAGAGLIRNRAAGGAQQSYVARVADVEQVTVAPTGSGAGRSDLIVLQVEDPYLAGEPWQEPTDPAQGPYVFVRVIPNVYESTTRLQDLIEYEGRTAITLARIDIPPSTGAITAAMITDLRKVARPRSERFIVNETVVDGYQLTSSSFVDWPIDGGVTVQVPEWATQLTVRVDLQAAMIGPNANGYFRLGAGATLVREQHWNIDTAAGGSERVTLQVGGTVPLVHSPGGPLLLKLRARRAAGSGYLVSRDATFMFDIQFNEIPI